MKPHEGLLGINRGGSTILGQLSDPRGPCASVPVVLPTFGGGVLDLASATAASGWQHKFETTNNPSLLHTCERVLKTEPFRCAFRC